MGPIEGGGGWVTNKTQKTVRSIWYGANYPARPTPIPTWTIYSSISNETTVHLSDRKSVGRSILAVFAS